MERGYAAAEIPTSSGTDLKSWLEQLLRIVPSADVMDAARAL